MAQDEMDAKVDADVRTIRDVLIKTLEDNQKVMFQDVHNRLIQLNLRMDALQRQVISMRDKDGCKG